jgi:hypothetical protein
LTEKEADLAIQQDEVNKWATKVQLILNARAARDEAAADATAAAADA